MTNALDEIRFSELPDDGNHWVVIEHGAVRWNNDAQDEPLVDIALREVGSDTIAIRQVAKSYTVYLFRGSVWKNGFLVGERDDLVDMTLDFDLHQLKDIHYITAHSKDIELKRALNRSSGAIHDDPLYAISPKRYPIPSQLKRTKYFPVRTNQGVELIVNCLTVFDALYGHGQFMRKTLFNYYSDKALKLLEFKDYDINEFENPPRAEQYQIGVKTKVLDADVPLVFGLKEFELLQKSVNYLSSQLTRKAEGGDRYLSIRPWFEGNHQWHVTGLWLEPGKRFLALRINKFKYPQLPSFYLVRENRNAQAQEPESGSGTVNLPLYNTDKKPKTSGKGKSNSRSRSTKLFSGSAEMWGEPDIEKPRPKKTENDKGSGKTEPKELNTVSPSDMNSAKSNAGKVDVDRDKQQDNPNKQLSEEESREALYAINLISKALAMIQREQSVNAQVHTLNDSLGWTQHDLLDLSFHHFQVVNNWCLNKRLADRHDEPHKCPKRKYVVLRLRAKGMVFYFVALERFKNNRFRTGILSFSSDQELLEKLPLIEKALIDKKGVWRNINAPFLFSTVSHGAESVTVAKQICRKLGLSLKLGEGDIS